mgnify:CR=1 FL=1
MRRTTLTRSTRETRITVSLNLDGTGQCSAQTGIGFFDHMLDQLARHSGFDIEIEAAGDLHIDAHHTVEDSGILLGQALKQALGDKRGLHRYGHAYLPMDETLARAALDLSNRPFLVWQVELPVTQLGNFHTELAREFFQAFAQHGGITLHMALLYGANTHHKIEALFKACARALAMACRVEGGHLPSTKGAL